MPCRRQLKQEQQRQQHQIVSWLLQQQQPHQQQNWDHIGSPSCQNYVVTGIKQLPVLCSCAAAMVGLVQQQWLEAVRTGVLQCMQQLVGLDWAKCSDYAALH